MVALLCVLKIVATATCYASGNAGGIFGPSLFIGAMMGAATGGVAHKLFPGVTAGPGAYALVGMGTAFAGIIRTPFTSVIMIFELTRDYTIIVPLMISNTIAYFISQKLQKVTIYDALAQQDGVHLPSAHAHGPSGPGNVKLVMRPASLILSGETTVQQAIQDVSASSLEAWPVSGRWGFSGMIRRTDLANAIAREAGTVGLETLLHELMPGDSSEDFPHVHPDHSLHLALERMGSSKMSVLPVVSRASIRQLLGIVVLDDVLKAYGVSGS
jgi:CIC family chloride channel protein